MLAAMPSRSSCKPLAFSEDNPSLISSNNRSSDNNRDDYVYAPELLKASSEDSEEALGSRFEFQKKITASSSSSNEPASLELVHVDNPADDALLNNSSMIVRVIVTSSSSSSSSTSSSSELDKTDLTDDNLENASIHYTVSDDHKLPQEKNLSKDLPPFIEEGQLELKKLPKLPNQPEEPVDIFSAFYRAFSQDSTESPPSTLSFSEDHNPITTFTLKPSVIKSTVIDTRVPSPDNHQLYTQQQRQHQRRRLFRNRQIERRRALLEARQQNLGGGAVEEAARKLEFLASKLDKDEEDKMKYSSTTITPESLISPSKIVSVAVSKSVAASTPIRKVSSPPRSINPEEDEEIEKVKSELISASYFPPQRQKIHGPQTSPLIPNHRVGHGQQPKSFLKSAPTSTTQKRLNGNNNGYRSGAGKRHNIISSNIQASEGSSFAVPRAEPSTFFEVSTTRPLPNPRRNKITRTVSSEIGDPSSLLFNLNNLHSTIPTTTQSPKVINWQEPAKVWSEPAKIWGEPSKVWGEPERVWSEPAKVWSEPEKIWSAPKNPPQDDHMQGDQPPQEIPSGGTEEEDSPPEGTFVVLGDDENEGDSIDGDLGRPLMLHHFTIPPNDKPTVSVSTSVSSSISTNGPTSRRVPQSFQDQQAQPSQPQSHHRQYHFQHHQVISTNKPSGGNYSSDSGLITNNNNNSSDSLEINSQQPQPQKKTGKKFGYVIEGANVRKYRVEERTPDGYIVGEYGVLNNQNAFLRGVRYTADGTINPRLIHEALMKFLSLRR